MSINIRDQLIRSYYKECKPETLEVAEHIVDRFIENTDIETKKEWYSLLTEFPHEWEIKYNIQKQTFYLCNILLDEKF